MYPGEVDGFTLFSGGEAEAGQGTVQGPAFTAGSGGEIHAWLWKRDETEPRTSRQHRFSPAFPLGLLFVGRLTRCKTISTHEFNLQQDPRAGAEGGT